MIDPHNMQNLLKDTKLTSMSDVINFVVDQVYKMMSYDPIQDLAIRISDLEKPKGLDHVMIQEVKTLIEAILQQKQDQIRKDLQKTVHHNVEYVLEQQNTRRSLKQIDVFELINSANQSRKSSIYSLNKTTQPESSGLQSIKKEIQELRKSISKKPDQQQINNKILEIQKEVSNKMPLSETQRIVEKFQKQIFTKLNQTSVSVQKMWYDLKKTLLEEVHQFKKQFSQNNKIKELKSSHSKLEKKIRKIHIEIEQLQNKYSNEASQFREQIKDSIDQVCGLVESLNQKKIQQKELTYGIWTAESQYNLNNMAICWGEEIANLDDQIFQFEKKKSQIMIIEPGFYKVESIVVGSQQPPGIFINGEGINKMRQKSNKYGNNNFTLFEILYVEQNNTLVSIRLSDKSTYDRALINVTRID